MSGHIVRIGALKQRIVPPHKTYSSHCRIRNLEIKSGTWYTLLGIVAFEKNYDEIYL
jgi:hypothetical protein